MDNVTEKVFSETAKILEVPVTKLTLETGVGDIPEWDSLGHTRVIVGLEEVFDMMIDVEEALEIETMQDIVELVQEKAAR